MKKKLYFLTLLNFAAINLFSQTFTVTPPTGPYSGNGSYTITPISFTITNTGGSQGGDWTITATISGCPAGNICNFTGCTMTVGNGSNATNSCNGSISVTGTANGAVSGTYTATRVPALTRTSGFSYNVVLPIDLTNFSLNNLDSKINIVWSTASELNNEKFLIERSTDGRAYKTIGEVAGAGTTTEPQEYHFTDETPAPGINYYRLKQMDFDGNFEYSPIESVVFRKEGEITIYPTIVQSELQVELPEKAGETTTLKIFSMQGALLQTQQQDGTGKLTITLPELTAGQYMVEVVNGNLSSRSIIFKQ